MKAKLYDDNRVIKVVDCNDVDSICNSCDRYTNYVEVHMRDHSTLLCDDFVFMLEGEDELMKEILRTEYEKGRYDMREQMLSEAVEREVKVDAGGYPYIDATEFYNYDKEEPLAKAGDKVKVIIVKK